MNISIDEYNTMKQEIDELKKKNEELEIIHSYLKKYPMLGLKRLTFELEQNENIMISEQSLRLIKKEQQ